MFSLCWMIVVIFTICYGRSLTGCESACTVPITWDSVEQACFFPPSQNPSDGVTYNNTECGKDSGHTLFTCLQTTFSEQLLYPGACGCPNSCFDYMGKGKCVNNECVCDAGFAGPDCSQVACPNDCNGRGACVQMNGQSICQCDDGYALNDCSAEIGPLPPYVMTVNGSQFSKWDKYGLDHPIFNMSTIAQIYVTLSEADLQILMSPSDERSSEYMNGSMWFYNGIVSENTSIGIRLHGSLSRSFLKKSWKIEFQEGKIHHIKGFYLKGATLEPSYAREILSTAIAYSMNSPISRLSFGSLYINNIFYGLYLIIEDNDKEFLKSRFGNDKGALYKCCGDFTYYGRDPELYMNATCGYNLAYEPQTDAAQNFTNLIELIYLINHANDSSDIEQIFDLDLFIRTFVMEVATGNWDGIFDANNYYLYFNPDVNKFQYFRHDLDFSYGFWEETFWGNFSSRNIYTWGFMSKGQIIINKLLSFEDLTAKYTTYFEELLKAYFYPQSELEDLAKAIIQVASPAVIQDYWHRLDSAISYKEFLDSLEYGTVRGRASVIAAVTNFIDLRYRNAKEQLQSDKL